MSIATLPPPQPGLVPSTDRACPGPLPRAPACGVAWRCAPLFTSFEHILSLCARASYLLPLLPLSPFAPAIASPP